MFCLTRAEDSRNHPNHRNTMLTMKDITDHWIGLPKSPYTHFTATMSPPTSSTAAPTSAPVSAKKPTTIKKKKRRKSSESSKRRTTDPSEPLYYRDNYYRERAKFAFPDFDYDYDSPNSAYSNPPPPPPSSSSPYIIRATASSPKAIYLNPSETDSSISAVYAGTPKVATYVIPSAKKYVVRRVKSRAVYVPPPAPIGGDLYAAASSAGLRRLDPGDYDENSASFLNMGPQEGFPPRPVMNKISQPGQRQPCHGPECHQHHKGLVRFYWRRVVYPPDEGRRIRGRGRRLRRPRTRPRGRRVRVRSRAPSDQREMYTSEEDGVAEGAEDNNTYENEEDEEEVSDEEETEENDTVQQNMWQPGRGYGHNLSEGSNYDDDDRRVYRDKRYAYRKKTNRNFYQYS
ncbi:uncharacterized protein LOC118182061 isoform X2 [Stegodyphus dumicola]|nr:uncharacterized protein LOC118182061 isoform X2 [Stegodyphus dumicola]